MSVEGGGGVPGRAPGEGGGLGSRHAGGVGTIGNFGRLGNCVLLPGGIEGIEGIEGLEGLEGLEGEPGTPGRLRGCGFH